MAGLRDRARQLFDTACKAAEPGFALSRAMDTVPMPMPEAGRRLLVIAVGKAAIPMAECALAQIVWPDLKALIVTNAENARAVPGATVLVAGHPIPDSNGAAAAKAVEAQLAPLTARDRVVALISGGASALLPAPVDGVSLADKAAVSALMLGGGLEISQMNTVRQALSRLKGGGLVRAAAPAAVTAYILSDVIGDDLRAIGSGLTAAPIGNYADARAVLQRHGIADRVPASVRVALQRPDNPTPLPQATNVLIGSNRKSLDAVLAEAGPTARIESDALTCDVAQAAERIVVAARLAGEAECLIFGGETVVTLRGTGRGGRNQELALRVAMAMPELGRDWVFLSGGTDGRDGPTDAAGGVVDAGTAARIHARGGDPDALLANNDSYRALDISGDLLMTGATATNVADVQILLLAKPGQRMA